MRDSFVPVVVMLAGLALADRALAAGTCGYTVQSRFGFLCPPVGATVCVSMSSVTGACDRPLRCVSGLRTLFCNLTLTPKSGPAPQCPFGSIRLERLDGLRCSRNTGFGATRTVTPTRTRTATPTPTAGFPCPDPNATPTPGTPPPGGGNHAITPGPCTSDESGEAGTLQGSIVILPKIVVDAGRDTVVQLTNHSNVPASARCFYVDGRLTDPTQPPGPLNPPLLTVTDFMLRLTPQQPTYWTVSSGRSASGGPTDPGAVPPLAAPFAGELKCAQVDDSGLPLPGNSLTAAATLLGPAGDVSKYDAFTLIGDSNGNDTDSVFSLDDVEYSACPAELRFNIVADGAADPILGAGSSVSTRLTLAPCRQDFAQPRFANIPVLALSRDEFELQLSAAFLVNGFLDIDLRDLSIAFTSIAGESFRQIRVLPIGMRCVGGANDSAPCSSGADCPGGQCLPSGPLVGMIETTRRDAMGRTARSAQLLQSCGANPNAAITLPAPPP